jgi:hypothetical protein
MANCEGWELQRKFRLVTELESWNEALTGVDGL